MPKLTETAKIELENVVDRYGITAVIDCLAKIAHEKAQHVRANWQDEYAGKCFEKVGMRLDVTAEYVADYLGR